jgi:hypothetical protein
MHAWFTPGYHDGVNIFFAAFQDFQGSRLLQKRRLRINGYAPVVAEGAAEVAAGCEEHAGYFVGVINQACFL